MNTILVGNTMSEKQRAALEKMGYSVLLLPPFFRLGKGVQTHADMLLFYDGERLLLHREYYEDNESIFDSLGVELVLSDEFIGAQYPDDVRFNAVLTAEGILFAKKNSVSEHIEKKAKKFVPIKQGYTACSTCRVSENAFITTDIGLCKAYREMGIDAITVTSEGISLPGFDCGFIGGASLVLREGICFFGDVCMHPDYRTIYEFAAKYGKKVIALSDEKLTDIGGGVVIK